MRSKSAVAAALLTVLTLLPLAAAPVLAKDPAKTSRQQTIEYWTAERVASAKPRDFVRTASGFQPKAKPGSGGAVTGASWTKGGYILARSGKVLFTMGGSNYVCSASVINETKSDRSLVLTAGHCAYDEVAEAFATNWMFVPEFDSSPTFTCSATTHGCWTAKGLVVHNGYASAGGFNEQATAYDFAVAIVQGGGKAVNSTFDLKDTVGGGFDLQTSGVSAGDKLYAFGYPAAGRYKGRDLTYCAGNIIQDSLNNNATWGMACNMTGGSSGGPWLASFTESTGSGILSSLNSYGYSGIANMYGPKFNSNTGAVLSTATNNASVGNDIVN